MTDAAAQAGQDRNRARPVAARAWFRICHFWVTRTCKERRPVRAGFRQAMCPVREAASLPGSSPLGLKRSQAQQGEPVWMALSSHQLPRALALALGVPAAHKAAVVQEEPQQVLSALTPNLTARAAGRVQATRLPKLRAQQWRDEGEIGDGGWRRHTGCGGCR